MASSGHRWVVSPGDRRERMGSRRLCRPQWGRSEARKSPRCVKNPYALRLPRSIRSVSGGSKGKGARLRAQHVGTGTLVPSRFCSVPTCCAGTNVCVCAGHGAIAWYQIAARSVPRYRGQHRRFERSEASAVQPIYGQFVATDGKREALPENREGFFCTATALRPRRPDDPGSAASSARG